MPQRFSIYIEDEKFLERLRHHKPATLSLSSFLGFCAEQHLNALDTAANVPAYCVGAGDTHVKDSVPSTSSKQDHLQEAPHISASKKILPPPSGLFLGDGVGMEEHEEEGKRKGTSLLREIPDNLEPYTDLIREFWRVKKGSKSSNAWSLLITELEKINASFGKDRTEEQLTLAINGLWKGITMRNMQRFETPKEKAAREEPKHPASRVFTAKHGFDEPATNPVLRDLF